MTLQELRRRYKTDILALADKYGAENVRVFGSVARGDAGDKSDVDLLVRLRPGIGLWELGGLHESLQQLLQCEVDVVPEQWIYSFIKETALPDAVPL